MARTLVVAKSNPDDPDRTWSYAAVVPDSHTFGAAEGLPDFFVVEYPNFSDDDLNVLLEQDPGLPAGQAPHPEGRFRYKFDFSSLSPEDQLQLNETGHLVVLDSPVLDPVSRKGPPGTEFVVKMNNVSTITYTFVERRKIATDNVMVKPVSRTLFRYQITDTPPEQQTQAPPVQPVDDHKNALWDLYATPEPKTIAQLEAQKDAEDPLRDRREF